MTRPSALARVIAAGITQHAELDDLSAQYRTAIENPFRVVVADPPWPFGDRLPGPGRGAAKHYGLLSIADIRDRQFVGGNYVSDATLADDAYLFLWRVPAGGSDIRKSTLLEDAYAVARGWGFVPKTEMIWCKETKHGKQHFGMGRHVRMSHEACIVATRGNPKPLSRSVRSVLHAAASRNHSEKPQEFYSKMVEMLSAGPYLELFARRSRPGWTCVGNEI